MKNGQAEAMNFRSEDFPEKVESKSTAESVFIEPKAELSKDVIPAAEKRDFSDVFARMKKSVRKKSVSIF